MSEDKINWQKNVYPTKTVKILMATFLILFLIPFSIAFYLIGGLKLVLFFLISTCLGIVCKDIVVNLYYTPQKVGISNTGIHLRYWKSEKIISWNEIDKITYKRYYQSYNKHWTIVKKYEDIYLNTVNPKLIAEICNQFEIHRKQK